MEGTVRNVVEGVVTYVVVTTMWNGRVTTAPEGSKTTMTCPIDRVVVVPTGPVHAVD